MSVSIVAVDDETDVADLFRQHFRREVRQGQYVLHFACSGEDALGQLARGIEPQLIVILSDINMPGMDGLTLLQEIKEDALISRSSWSLPTAMRSAARGRANTAQPSSSQSRSTLIFSRRSCGSWQSRQRDNLLP